MKTKVFFSLFAAMILGISCSFAQNYPSFKDNPYAETIKIKGQRPTIVDFANYMFREPEEEEGSECTGWLRNACTLDVQNGYVKFEGGYEDEDSKVVHVSEMCYWNCSDGTGWYRIENGKKIYMTTEERNMWYEETHPEAVYHLPRKGKNITVDLVYPGKTETITLTWDGLKFNAPEGY